MREDKFSVKDKRDLCRYHKDSQFCEVADITYFTIYTSDSNKYLILTQRFSLLILSQIKLSKMFKMNVKVCMVAELGKAH